MSAAGIRERNRRDLTEALLAAGREQLAEVGAAGLSLRSVARDVGMVPSAVYRYFPSRDDLLTALLVDSYNGLADALTAADSSARPADLAARWRAVCGAARAWALARPHEWALLYGSPVPGYGAPGDTIAPAVRIARVFAGLTATISETADPPPPAGRLAASVRHDMSALKRSPVVDRPDLPDVAMLRGIGVWVQVFGLISFELFGQFENVVHDRDGFFAAQVDQLYRTLVGG